MGFQVWQDEILDTFSELSVSDQNVLKIVMLLERKGTHSVGRDCLIWRLSVVSKSSIVNGIYASNFIIIWAYACVQCV